MLNLKSLIILFLISFSFQDQNCLITFKKCEYPDPYKEIKINHCIEHDFNDGIEYCEECENGYLVSDDEKSCIEVTKRIDHCIRYYKSEEDFYCNECENNYVNSDDSKSCVEVTNKINHCISYYNYGVGVVRCEKCENNYFLNYNSGNYECVKFDHCSNLYDKDHCNYCIEGYALSNDRTSCKSFANCEQLDKEGTKCSICYEHYHPNSDGRCEITLCSKYVNNVCTACYGGYFLNDNKECQKITIENCLQLDSSKKKCSACIAGITPDTNGNCNIKLIEGCEEYESNGNCKKCNKEYDKSSDGKKCEYVCTGGKSIEYCGFCKPGYYEDHDGICLGYDGSKDSSSNERHKVQYALLSIILLLLI